MWMPTAQADDGRRGRCEYPHPPLYTANCKIVVYNPKGSIHNACDVRQMLAYNCRKKGLLNRWYMFTCYVFYVSSVGRTIMHRFFFKLSTDESSQLLAGLQNWRTTTM